MNALQRSFDDVTCNVENRLKTKDDIISFLQGADGAIVGRERIDDSIMAQCPDLKNHIPLRCWIG